MTSNGAIRSYSEETGPGELRWLVQLRWWALAGQLASIAYARWAEEAASELAGLFVLAALFGVSNLLLSRKLGRAAVLGPNGVGAILLFDCSLFALTLFLSGGPSNPFSVFFLVQVTLAAAVLGSRWTWITALYCCVCFGALFLFHVPELHHHHGTSGHFSTHLFGMWMAFVFACIVIAQFLSRIVAEAREKSRALRELELLKINQERLSALTTLSAGAAHELATPLGTIALAANELERNAAQSAAVELLREDAQLIASEVARCRAIIDRMGARGGSLAGELPVELPVEALFSQLRDELGAEAAARVRMETAPERGLLRAPRQGLLQTLLALLRNALDASAPGQPVRLRAAFTGEECVFEVLDEGSGIASEHLPFVSDPFFTTKPPGKGMGLGLFLARLFVDKVRGDLAFSAREGGGTRALVRLPLRERSGEREAA